MSSYRSSASDIRVPTISERIQAQCTLLLQREGAWVSSIDFDRATRADITGQATTERLSESLGRLRAMSAMHRLTQAAAGDLLKRAEQALSEALKAGQLGDTPNALRLATAGEKDLRRGVKATHRKLVVDDRSLVSTVAAGALGRLGFTVRKASGTRSTGLWAIRGHEVVAVLVHDGGATEMDIAGHSGNGCDAVTAAIGREMALDGVTLKLARVDRHGDSRGGTLIQRAAKCGGGAPGVVAQQEIGLPVAGAGAGADAQATAVQIQNRAVGQ